MAGRSNILISSAGRRVRLVEIAQEAARDLGLGRVLATDMRPAYSAPCHRADESFAVPALSEPDFLEVLWSIVHRNDVGLVIPTLDTELQLLAGVRDDWAEQGVFIAVSDADFVANCRDKWRTNAMFGHLGVDTPRVIDDETTFPRFVKPVAGSLSQDIHVVASQAGLDPAWTDTSSYLQQELIGADEYAEFTVDMYFSRSGDLSCLVPRERLEVRGGEISKGRTHKGRLLPFLRERFSWLPGARGCLTAQFFVARDWTGSERAVLGIEVNPRFGGGYPLTDAAGGRYVEWLAREYLLGEKIEYRDDWTDGLVMLRYDAEVLVG